MKKILSKLNKVYKKLLSNHMDKLLHFLVAFVITTLGTLIFSFLQMFLIVFVISVIKEIYDKMRYGTPEHKDVIAGLLGSLFSILITTIRVAII